MVKKANLKSPRKLTSGERTQLTYFLSLTMVDSPAFFTTYTGNKIFFLESIFRSTMVYLVLVSRRPEEIKILF